MEWNAVERRKKKRYGIRNSTLRYKRAGLVSFLSPHSPKFMLLNISEGGCHFISRDNLAPNDKINLIIDVPKLREPIHAKGRIVWCRKSEDIHAYRVGLEFLPLSTPSKKLLKTALESAILDNVEISTRVYLKEMEKI